MISLAMILVLRNLGLDAGTFPDKWVSSGTWNGEPVAIHPDYAAALSFFCQVLTEGRIPGRCVEGGGGRERPIVLSEWRRGYRLDVPKNTLVPTTKPKHPWTNGQVERMNRTIKEATVQRFHYQSHQQLRQHLADFVAAYNFGRRLKTLKGLTPFEYICKSWTSQPQRFILNPLQQMPGLNI
jgi:hypothetical protein